MDNTSFEWPWQYSFPPFFTIQKNKDVLATQMDTWSILFISWAKAMNVKEIDVAEAISYPVFNNAEISRSLNPEAVKQILEELSSRKNFKWTDKSKSRGIFFWRTPNEWASQIYSWVQKTARVNTVCTLYEITNGDDSTNTEFYELDKVILLEALDVLRQDGKAELLSVGDEEGVKFF